VSVAQRLRAAFGEAVLPDSEIAARSHDATESQGLHGRADAVIAPRSADEVVELVAWSYEHHVPLIPRGGGTGFAGGAVPVHGGVVVDMSRMNRILAFEPELWRIRVEAGLRTAELHRIARENGLSFPPDPGASESSQVGGNLATNAGGPHAFKYGVTGDWVTGLRAVIPPGRIVEVGGPLRKDVAGYDLKRLLIGSEGTLGIITDAWLRLMPAPEVAAPLAATYPSIDAGCAAIARVREAGLIPAALEYLDTGALRAGAAAFPAPLHPDAGFLVIAEVDGAAATIEPQLDELRETLGPGSLDVHRPDGQREIAAFWRWRGGLSYAVEAIEGGKMSEDVVVPVDRLQAMIEATLAIGARHELPACSWGHAGDGNLHSTFCLDPRDAAAVARARNAAEDLFATAAALGDRSPANTGWAGSSAASCAGSGRRRRSTSTVRSNGCLTH
jgi:FAD/FMN-containing dehydrogenase